MITNNGDKGFEFIFGEKVYGIWSICFLNQKPFLKGLQFHHKLTSGNINQCRSNQRTDYTQIRTETGFNDVLI